MNYTLDIARHAARELVGALIGPGVNLSVNVTPPNVDADLAVPLFEAARRAGEAPGQFTTRIAETVNLSGSPFARISAQGGFLNFTFDPAWFAKKVLDDCRRQGASYGGSTVGAGKLVVIDLSAPNIAKPFSVGHLRSTVLGAAIADLLRFQGWEVKEDNHIGDWGTQFGKLIYAYNTWGNEAELAADPIGSLLSLYTRFHQEAQDDPALDEQARQWFKRLEDGDQEATALWQRFREHSLKDFKRIYEMMDVSFDLVLGESFYNDQLDAVVNEALEKGLATIDSDGSIIVDLKEHGFETPLLIRKKDGASLYATRDLATAIYRIRTFHPHWLIYVVGADQKLYFRQWFKVLELLGYNIPCTHVWFGLVRLPEGRMSTRKGRIVLLEEVLKEAVERAREMIREPDLDEEEKTRVARMVGIGAVIYADLSQSRQKDIVFSWEKMLSLSGNSAPYLQYSQVRTRSILRKAGIGEANSSASEGSDLESLWNLADGALLVEPEEVALLQILAAWPDVVAEAAAACEPHRLAVLLFDLAQQFSRFYTRHQVIKASSPALRATRLILTHCVGTVLRTGLGLLGIRCPTRM